jgi:hypothetical protein
MPEKVLGIELWIQMKMLGVSYGTSIESSTKKVWEQIIRARRTKARNAYARNRCLSQIVQQCLLSQIWYVAQILPQLPRHMQQITSVRTWFIWKGAIFRVPATALQRPKTQGGWQMLDIAVKCRTLLLSRMWQLSKRKGTATAAWMKKWYLTDTIASPPQGNRVPQNMAYRKH